MFLIFGELTVEAGEQFIADLRPRLGLAVRGAAVHLDHFRGGLQAHRHFVGLVAEDDAFLLAGDLIHVARVAVVRDEREDGDDRRDDQPRLEAAALRAAERLAALRVVAAISGEYRRGERDWKA